MGVVIPSDTFPGGDGNPSSVRMYDIELVSPGGGKGGGGAVSSNETINRHNNLMMMSVLADFLILGHGPNGTEALADSKKGMFFQATEGFLNSMAAVYNRDGLPRVFELNGMDADLLPEYTPDMSQEVDLDILSNYILRLSQSGMAIFPNEELESALMDAAGLPDIAESGAMDALGGKDAPQHIVGPLAAAAAAALAPKPDPVEPGQAPPGMEQNSPADKFQKMIRGSLARRFVKLNNAEASILRKRNLPRPRGSDRRA
jgi:phage gp29-like protein